MIDPSLLIFLIAWCGTGLVAFLLGTFLSWWDGKNIEAGELLFSFLVCMVLGGIALFCVGLHLMSLLFNARKVLVRGRGRCVECDARGHHKMSCSQQYKRLGDA